MTTVKETKKQNESAKQLLRKRLTKEAMKEIQPIALGSLAMIASTLCNQAVPRLLGKLLDQSPASASASGETCSTVSNSTMSSLALVVLGGGLASFLRTTMLNRAQDSIASRLRSQTFGSLLTQQDMETFHVDETTNTTTTTTSTTSKPSPTSTSGDNMTPAAMLTILQEDVTVVAHSITGNIANLLRSSCSCLFGTYHMITLNPSLFAVSASIVPLIGTAAMILRKFITKVASQQRETATLAASFAHERLTHIHMVKMSNRELQDVQEYTKYQQDVVTLGRKVSLANGAFMGFIFAASSGALFLVFHQGGRSVAAGLMTAGELTSFATYTFLLGLGTSGVFKAMSDMTQGLVAADRVYKLMDATTLPVQQQATAATNVNVNVSTITSISLHNISFSYKANPSTIVLNDVSLELARGAVIALVGQNGSGKTTMASLLAALYTPTSGTIILSDQTNYTTLSRDIQRRLVQVVPQSPALFNMSILDNVRYATPNATEQETLRAMTLANCDDFVTKLGGIHYNVGLMGTKLSGGQRQRIALARALLADPMLLVLDEPTSSMDHFGEEAVAVAVEACRTQHRGLLLITHNPKSLLLADVVVVLKDGHLVEMGTLTELVANKGSELCRLMPDLVVTM